MVYGRIVKILGNITTIESSGQFLDLSFKTKHSIFDIIDESDTLLVRSHKAIDYRKEKIYQLNRLNFIEKTKQFFKALNFLEALTPKLKRKYLSERNINKIKSKYGYLVPSFELELKKLLCLGFDKVFELNFAYRDDFEDNWHKKEFLMLEWYRAYSKPSDIFDDFKNLCAFLNGSDRLKINGFDLDFKKIEFFSYKELFMKYLNLDIDSHLDKSRLIKTYSLEPNLAKSGILDFLFAADIEKYLGRNSISVVYGFPDFTFLAKKEGKYAKRYEFYINGIEIANCYDEENDYLELKKHFNKQTDEEFINYIGFGMPPASGIAFGFDRFLQILLDQQN